MNKRPGLKDLLTAWKGMNAKKWILVGLAGVLLLGISGLTRSAADQSQETAARSEEIDAETYRQTLCREVTDLCNSLTSNRTVTVNITLENEVRCVYASEVSSNKNDKTEEGKSTVSTDSKTTYIKVKKAAGGEEAVLVTRYMPAVRGVAVVLSGEPGEPLKNEVKQAVAAALGVSVRKVYVGQTKG